MSFLLTYVHRTAYLMNVLLTYCKSFPRRFITLFLFHKGLKKPVTFLPRNVTFVTPVRARRVLVFDTRYSCDNQTEQSIEGQLRVCEEYAQKNNILILDTYIDRAMTGTNDNRLDFQRMLKDSSRKEWNFVLV